MLKQQIENTTSGWQHNPAAPTPAARFDKDALQEILATAAQLQKAEQDSLSQAEVESIAAEMGISPQHVRQAISQRNSGAHRLPRISLSVRQKTIVTTTILLYSLFMTWVIAMTAHPPYNPALRWVPVVTLIVLPALIAVFLGYQTRHKRPGAVSGSLLSVAIVVIMQIVIDLPHHVSILTNGGIWFVLMLVSGGAVAGAVGAAVYQWRNHQRPLPVPIVNEPSNFDR